MAATSSRRPAALLVLVAAAAAVVALAAAGDVELLEGRYPPLAPGLSFDFYKKSCPKAESIVKEFLSSAVQQNVRLAAALIRLHFHDCFVQGCDASVLLDSTPTQPSEQLSPPNLTLRPAAFKAVNDIRARLEQACGRVVSCADIVALAARESVALVRVVRVVYAIAFFVALYIHLRTVNKLAQSYAYMLYSLDCCGMHPTHTYFILYFSFLL